MITLASLFDQSLLSIYFGVIAGLGFGGLVAMFIFGELIDHGHDFFSGDTDVHGGHGSQISIHVIFLFMIGLGCGGYAGSANGLSAAVSTVAGIFAGIGIGFVGMQVLRFFHSSQASSVVTTAQLIGAKGVTTVGIPTGGIGEIVVRIGNGQEWYAAKTSSGTPVQSGVSVHVVQTAGSVVIVEPITNNQPWR